MDKMLCTVAGQDLTVSGFEGGENQEFLMFAIEECINGTGYNCYSSSDVTTYMNNHFLTNDYFKVKLLMLDTLIAPFSDVYLTQAL